MKYQCIIVEDNAVERDLLEVLLGKRPDIVISGIFENGLEALRYLQGQPVDIAFADVDMPELSGMGLLKSLRHPPVFIFISAHSKYAADGYDLDVPDFVRKPFSPERLFKAVDKAIEQLKQQRSATLDPMAGATQIVNGAANGAST
ncbi:response regulator receiver domain protein, partial [Ostertagia ostertagi]